jgi:hypothetical protein
MSTLEHIRPAAQKFVLDRLCRETGCDRASATAAYTSANGLYEQAKQSLLLKKDSPPIVETALVAPTRPAQNRTATKPPVLVSEDTNTFPVTLPNGDRIRVVRLPDDYVARSRAEWQKKKANEEEDERLATGNTITRALDLCSRLAARAADPTAERIIL